MPSDTVIPNGGAMLLAVTLGSTLNPVSAGMGDHLRAGIPPWYVTKAN